MPVTIKDIAYHLPDRIITNDEFKKEHPSWDMDHVEKSIGVKQCYIARDDETALDLALKACQKLFSQNKDLKTKVDGLIFCTQSEDYIMPPNSCILHKMLELSEDTLAFDFNLACSGYIYGLALAKSLILSCMAKDILLVNADTYSKYTNKKDRSVRVVFSDAAAVSWITSEDAGKGIIDIKCSTLGKGYDKFIIPAGACRMPKSDKTKILETDKTGNERSLEDIHMNGLAILEFIKTKVPPQIRQLLEKNNLTLDDIDLFIFHQASKMALDTLTHLLNIDPNKTYRNIERIGNAVSASIPIALKQALDEGKISKGDRVLLCGFGVGLSWGTAIFEV